MAGLFRRIRLHNFKSAAEVDVPLAPLTLVVGANSAGKSTLLQAILLQVQAVESGVRGSFYPLNGPRVRLGNYNDVLYAQAADSDGPPSIQIGCDLQLSPSAAARARLPGRSQRQPYVVAWDVRFNSGEPNAASSMAVVESRIQDIVRARGSGAEDLAGERFDLSVSAATASSDRRTAFELGGYDATEPGRWSVDFLGSVTLADELPEPEGVAGVELVAGFPRSVLVERPIAEVLSNAWLRAVWRAISIERSRRTQPGSARAQAAQRELEAIEQRIQAAERKGEEASGRELRERLTQMRAERNELVHAAVLPTVSPEASAEAGAALLTWAADDMNRLLGEGAALANASNRFYDYHLERRQRRAPSFPDFSSVGLEDLRSIADAASLTLAQGSVLVPLEAGSHAEFRGVFRPDVSPVDELLEFFGTSVRYLGPLREDPRTLYDAVPNARVGDIGAKGQATAAVLHALHSSPVVNPALHGQATTTTLAEALGSWLAYLQLGSEVSTHDQGRLGIELTVRQPGSGLDLDLTSVGVGVSQALPVLVLCLLSEPGAVLILEQPELHLHPATQQRLADFFVACARSGRQLIVETHSDHLVSRLRLRIAEDDDQEQEQVLGLVSILYATQEHGTTTYEHVQPNVFGAVDNWPKGFFDQSVTESQAILRAAIDKKKARAAAAEASS